MKNNKTLRKIKNENENTQFIIQSINFIDQFILCLFYY